MDLRILCHQQYTLLLPHVVSLTVLSVACVPFVRTPWTWECRYCSKTAQQSDWKRGHKYECKALRNPSVRPMSMLRLVARVLWKRAAAMKAAESTSTSPEPSAPPSTSPGHANLDDSMSARNQSRAEDSGQDFWYSYEAVAAMKGGSTVLDLMPRANLKLLLGSLRCRPQASLSKMLQDIRFCS